MEERRLALNGYDSLPDSAAEPRGLLKESIAARREIRGGNNPGEKIVEGRWARQYGVAQVSIREALITLPTEGFVTKGHGRSARVLKLGDAASLPSPPGPGPLEGPGGGNSGPAQFAAGRPGSGSAWG